MKVDGMLLEIAKQVPSLLVLSFIVVQFLKFLREARAEMREFVIEEQQKLMTMNRDMMVVVRENSEVLGTVKHILAETRDLLKEKS